MLFTQIEFILFLTIILLAMYYCNKTTLKKVILLTANLYFYAYFDYNLLLLLILSTLITFVIGKKIQYSKSEWSRNCFLFLGLAVNISILGIFKYFNFFIESINSLFALNEASISTLNIVLPLGVSFYTFRFISYLIDIYRKSTKTCQVFDFLIYGTFFPIIVSGPISKATSFIPQLIRIDVSSSNLYRGYRLFVIGLFLKVFVADRIAYYVNFFYENHEIFNSITAWVAVLSYSIQIYCDFAGYSNMAIGIALMIGICVEENFNFPYLAGNISDFWKRWHITLSLWIKDYLYVPLGGSRKGVQRKYINLLITMILCGLWHGPAWTFVLWGFLHGILLVINHCWKGSSYQTIFTHSPRFYSFASWLITFLSVTLCWIVFRSSDVGQAMAIAQKLFSFNNAGVSWLHPFVIFIILATLLIHIFQSMTFKFFKLPIESKITPVILFCLIWLVIVFYPKEFQPFVYLKF
jgi:alginate O-acetyltransferase complex protein AlgI